MNPLGNILHWLLTKWVRYAYGEPCEEKDSDGDLRGMYNRRGLEGRCPRCWAYSVLEELKEVVEL